MPKSRGKNSSSGIRSVTNLYARIGPSKKRSEDSSGPNWHSQIFESMLIDCCRFNKVRVTILFSPHFYCFSILQDGATGNSFPLSYQSEVMWNCCVVEESERFFRRVQMSKNFKRVPEKSFGTSRRPIEIYEQIRK